MKQCGWCGKQLAWEERCDNPTCVANRAELDKAWAVMDATPIKGQTTNFYCPECGYVLEEWLCGRCGLDVSIDCRIAMMEREDTLLPRVEKESGPAVLAHNPTAGSSHSEAGE